MVDTGFAALPHGTPLARYVKMQKIHDYNEISVVGTPRPMQTKDIAAVFKLYKESCKRYAVTFKFTQDELLHQLMPIDNVIQTLVVENE